MELIRYEIIPKSSFASIPTADMIFGHFARFLYMQNDNLLDDYLTKPKIIFSDFLPYGYMPKPTLPLSRFNVSDSEKKSLEKKSIF